MPRRFRLGAGLLVASLLAACIWDEEDPRYPDVDKQKLEGCWVAANPGSLSFECVERCYSGSGLFYSRSNRGDQGFVEAGGTYAVDGTTISRTVRIGNNTEEPDTTTFRDQSAYTLMRDTLFSIANGGADLNPFIRADSSNTCGPHWQVFPQPVGWDLD